MNRVSKLTLYVLACILATACLLALPSCGGTAGLFGIASVQDLNDQASKLQEYARETAAAEAKAKQAETEAAIVALLAPMEIVYPGTQQAARDVFAGKPSVVVTQAKKVDPVPDNSAVGEDLVSRYGGPAGQVALILAGAYTAYRKAKADAKTEVNAERDAKRRERGEALTPAEAQAKGYFEDGAKA